MDSSEINSLLPAALNGEPDARKALQSGLGLDDSNWSYFFCLYRALKSSGKKGAIRIYEHGKNSDATTTVYPLSIAPRELLQQIQVVDYRSLIQAPENFGRRAKDVSLWVKKMQAGSGSSLTRTTYLSREQGIPEAEVRIGAKGTDLLVELSDPQSPGHRKKISIAEAQILQSIASFERGEVGEVIFHDIVSSETEKAIRELWEKPAFLNPALSYRDYIGRLSGLRHFGSSFQSFIPTLDSTGAVSLNRRAPGGHALFAVDALRAAYRPELRPETTLTLIAAISNGEDLNSAPDQHILGYIADRKIPITLVTTERTAVDLKGGLLSAIQGQNNRVFLTVLETAQAQEAGQAELFAALPGMVSTNLTLFNYEVLVPLITREVQEIGEDAFMQVIAPDVISNTKEQRDPDGVVRKYVQMEGAMGSTIMNLDRYWRQKYGKPLVHLINVDREFRTEFFSPIKSAFDYWMQFYSDRFSVDPKSLRLKNARPGELPIIALKDPKTKDKSYQDVTVVLDTFESARIRELNELAVEGRVKLRQTALIGRVELHNQADRPADLSGRRIENERIDINSTGQMTNSGI